MYLFIEFLRSLWYPKIMTLKIKINQKVIRIAIDLILHYALCVKYLLIVSHEATQEGWRVGGLQKKLPPKKTILKNHIFCFPISADECGFVFRTIELIRWISYKVTVAADHSGINHSNCRQLPEWCAIPTQSKSQETSGIVCRGKTRRARQDWI